MKPVSKLVRPVAAALLPLLFAGCAGYRVGSMLPADIDTVFVPVFVNQTDEPQIEQQATRAAIAEIQRDGSLSVVQREAEADTVLRVTLLSYDLVPLAYDRDRKSRPNEFRIQLTAALVLTERATGKVLAQYGAARGETNAVVSGDVSSAKRAALPAVSRDLAHQIIERIVEAW